MQIKEYSLEVGGRPFIFQLSDLAEQASGSIIARHGGTTVLATVVMSSKTRDELDYFPLSVDYEERFYASGQILGSRFMRREGRPSDEAVLSGRVVDRTIRPLFSKHLRNEVQVVVTILSLSEDDPDILAVNGASLALALSNIPWDGPVSAVRIGKRKGSDEFIVNPSYKMREEEDFEMDLTVCGKDGKVNMIELGGKDVHEDVATRALEFGIAEIERMQEFQRMIVKENGAPKKQFPAPQIPEEMRKLFADEILPVLAEEIMTEVGRSREYALMGTWVKLAAEKLPEIKTALVKEYYDDQVNDLLHKQAVEENKRPGGRAMDELRELYAQAGGISPIIHGTGVFYRGQTHVLSALTLGGPNDSQVIDGMEIQTKKRFMHHYNFPPFSSGETGRVGGMNRRMIGHGALAEKAISAIIPPKEVFPYTIRIVSEVMSSNGSSSMASVCGSTLALMDAGVPILAPAAGIAMGLMFHDEKNYKVLTDIQGPEDHHGDMDLKVAGTSEGITAIQMDVKVDGIPIKILSEAFQQSKRARLQILETIKGAIAAPRADISPNAPKIVVVAIRPDQIGGLIGPGGKMVKKIREETGAEIDIEDDGTVYITGKNGSAEAAKKIIEGITHEYRAGERFEGPVTRLMEFGAFVKVGPNTEGLVHISEIAPFRVDKVSDILKEGDIVPVVVKEIDEKGRVNLSIKQADPTYAEKHGGKPSLSNGAPNNHGQSHSHSEKTNYRGSHGNDRRPFDRG